MRSKSRFRSFVEAKPHTTRSYDDLEGRRYIVEVASRHLTFGLLAQSSVTSSVVCGLRWTILSMVWLTSNGGTPTSTTGFPIIGVYREQRSEDRFTNAVRGIPDGARTIVQSVQPYNHANAYQLTHLWRVEMLWNIDKPRHIPLDAGACDIEFPQGSSRP